MLLLPVDVGILNATSMLSYKMNVLLVRRQYTVSCMYDFQFIMFIFGSDAGQFVTSSRPNVFTHEWHVITNILRLVIIIILKYADI